jgi:uncharacterized protein YjbI with pentapeptide repeats
MDITEFKRILTCFADDPQDVDIRLGQLTAQIRDEVIDVSIAYSPGSNHDLMVSENGEKYSARTWLLNRVARLPQLAERIIATTNLADEVIAKSPFVVPFGSLSPDLSSSSFSDNDVPTSDVVESLLEKASSPLPGATSVLYLTSDAGEGKTTIINRAARLQALKFRERKVGSLIIPIPLTGRAFLTFDDAVVASLVNKLRFNYLYYDAFVELVRMGAVVPAFDGYEEMLVEGSKNEAVSALGNLAQSLDSAGTVIVAARKAFFDYLSFKTQARLFDAIGNRSVSFSRLAISRWNRERFIEYGTLRGISEPESVYDVVETRFGSDHPLLTRAVLVRRLFDVVGKESDRGNLAELLGSSPQDYFYTFVNAIVQREASEKWLSRVATDVAEPLLTTDGHHELLSRIAQEMWETSSTSLRHDVVDVLVDIFCDDHKTSPRDVRQIKERLKQHSLLSADPAKGQALAFDHEDFQNFYTGEGLGRILLRLNKSELRTFLSVAMLPNATVEQSVQYVVRLSGEFVSILELLVEISFSEINFSFCKENCGALAIRISERLVNQGQSAVLTSMLFPLEALAGRDLHNMHFVDCHFQPTKLTKGNLNGVEFIECEFERIDLDFAESPLENCQFSQCDIASACIVGEEDCVYAPSLISSYIVKAGGKDNSADAAAAEITPVVDERIKMLERLLRIFIRSTQVDEEVIRLRLGSTLAPRVFDEVFPALISNGLLEEVPWKGRGVQRRYKLTMQMADISELLQETSDSFENFCHRISIG